MGVCCTNSEKEEEWSTMSMTINMNKQVPRNKSPIDLEKEYNKAIRNIGVIGPGIQVYSLVSLGETW